MLIPYGKKVQMLKYLTYNAELIYLFLAVCDNNMPQLGFNNVESADVTFLDPVLAAEPLPSSPTKVVAILV
jgi:hypothetical protein